MTLICFASSKYLEDLDIAPSDKVIFKLTSSGKLLKDKKYKKRSPKSTLTWINDNIRFVFSSTKVESVSIVVSSTISGVESDSIKESVDSSPLSELSSSNFLINSRLFCFLWMIFK